MDNVVIMDPPSEEQITKEALMEGPPLQCRNVTGLAAVLLRAAADEKLIAAIRHQVIQTIKTRGYTWTRCEVSCPDGHLQLRLTAVNFKPLTFIEVSARSVDELLRHFPPIDP